MGRNGFTLIDIIVVLAVTGILAGGMVTLGFQVINKEREDKTIEHLKRLKEAVMGDPLNVRHGVRTSFGYSGDMGVLPAGLNALYLKGVQPSYTFFSLSKAGAGWNGPYLDPELMEYLSTLTKDSFGQDLQYSTTPFVDATVGETVVGKITSSGRDDSVGTSDDLSVEFFSNELYSRVSGFVKDEEGDGVVGVTVAINYPSNGTLTSTSTVTDASGYYSFNNVPYGNLSLTPTPKLILASGSAFTQDNGTKVTFSVINPSASSVSISSFLPVYNVNPPAYYERLYIGGDASPEWDWQSNQRATSGETKAFTAVTLSAAPVTPEAVPLCVQSPVTEVPDICLTELGRGSAITVILEGFNSSQTGTGANLNMKGVPFTVTFSNGSVVTFTP
jgi:type II secretory pathway pseudopilin PulG